MSTSSRPAGAVTQLYVSLFGRAPDAEGLNHWAGMLASGQPMASVADAMFGSAPARAYLPEGLGNEQLIASVYQSALGRAADARGLAYWTARLDAPGATAGSVITEMIDATEHYAGGDPLGIASAALFNNRAEAAQFYGENGGSIANSASVLAAVSAQHASVLAARVLDRPSASGTVDAGGFAEVVLGSITGDVVLTHVAPDATLRLQEGPYRYSFDVQLLDASGSADALHVYLPAATYNFVRLKVDGFEHVDLIAPSTADWLGEQVWFGAAPLQTVTARGNGALSIMGGDIHFVDASAFAGSSFGSAMNTGTLMLGTPGNDSLTGFGTGGRMDGGAGDDSLRANGPITLVGGAGVDTFSFIPNSLANHGTIADFAKGTDKLSTYELVTSHPVTGPGYFGSWLSAPVALDTGATFTDWLDAATAGSPSQAPYATLRWFPFGGDAYLVVDNSSWASTFQDGVDQVVKFAGITDLGTFTYDGSHGLFG